MDKPEWTDAEVERVARELYEVRHIEDGLRWEDLSEYEKQEQIVETGHALSAVPRAPAGCWIAPDVLPSMFVLGMEHNDPKKAAWFVEMYTEFRDAFNRMRDAYRGKS